MSISKSGDASGDVSGDKSGDVPTLEVDRTNLTNYISNYNYSLQRQQERGMGKTIGTNRPTIRQGRFFRGYLLSVVLASVEKH